MATPPPPAPERPGHSAKAGLTSPLRRAQVCQRCGVGTRSGRGRGWCSDPECRKAEQEERQAQERAKKAALQEERTAKGAGSRGPVPVAASRRGQRQELQAQRSEEGMGSRGPHPTEDNREARRQQLQAERAEEGMGSRGPHPTGGDKREAGRQQLQAERAEEGMGSRGPHPTGGDKREAGRQQLQAERAEEGMGSRGPHPTEDNREARRQQLQAERAEEGMGSRGPHPTGGDKREASRQQLQAERAEEGMGSRGPKPIATEVQQQGYTRSRTKMCSHRKRRRPTTWRSHAAGAGSACRGCAMRAELSQPGNIAGRQNRQARCSARTAARRPPRSSCLWRPSLKPCGACDLSNNI